MTTIRLIAAAALLSLTTAEPAVAQRCDPDNGGISLPAGFCARVFADSLPAPRHMFAAANGDLYVSLSGRGGRSGGMPGGVVVLRDTDRDGRSDQASDVVRGFSSSDVWLANDYLYTETGTAVLRFPMRDGKAGTADTLVSGLPGGGGHGRKTFAIGRDGALYVNIGSASNNCENRATGTNGTGQAGLDPCTERDVRAAIWKFDAAKTGQKLADGTKFASGIRNAVGIVIGPDGALWTVQHGRDALFRNWPSLFSAQHSADNPAEELQRVSQGDDFGWPYCYYSNEEKKRVLAPEYGGDGKKTTRCEGMRDPVAAFPGHWAPNDLLFYTGTMFPAKYRGGVFVAFHGSWNRAPEPQAGFNVVFQPMRDGRAAGPYEVFADKFSPNSGGPGPNRRPTGVAQGPDGALYISDDATGRIWKVTYSGR